MTVSLILHFILAQNPIGLILNHNLIALIEGVRSLVEVTPSNQKESTRWCLYALKVVRKVHAHVYSVLDKLFGLKNVFMNRFGVSL
jgi:hypothetical protein